MSNVFVSKEILESDILSVTIRNHNKRNALSDSIKLELENIALELRDKTEIKAVILSGEKGNFCSGNDINEKNAFGDGLDLEAARQALNAVTALNTTGEYDGGCTPNVDMVSPLFVDKENSFNDTPEMADPYGDPYGVSPILANASPEQVRTSGGYSPR